MPKIPNMRNTHKMITITLRMPHIDCTSDEIIILISTFLDTMRNGLRILNSLKILRSATTNMFAIPVPTMKKSNFDQLSLRYDVYPMIIPRAIIFTTHSNTKTQLNAMSSF